MSKKLTLSILAIKNHPDICSVVKYLESLDLVPAQFGDLVFAMPHKTYADRFEAPIEWFIAKRAQFHCVFPNSGAGAYVAYSHTHNTIVALTESFEATGTPEMPSYEEQAIALYLLNILEKNGHKRKDIDVVYTNDEPEGNPFQDMMDAMVPPAVAENMAKDVLRWAIPDAEIPESFNPNLTFDGSQVSNINVPFKFAGQEFLCIFSREYKTTGDERIDRMTIQPMEGESDLVVKDPENARAELVNFFFNFDVYTEAHYDSRMVDFFCRAPVVGIDGTIEWTGTYRGTPLTIKCKENEFSFSAPGFTGGGFSYEELEKNLAECIVPPVAPGKEPECPFCSGKEVTFGSSQLHVQKELGLAVVYDNEGVAGNFKWKFCPECGKKL